jgi:imidazolonepropionase-like amidohydrolase
MNTRSLWPALATLALLVPACAARPARSSVLILDHVTVLDVASGLARADQTVVITGDTITTIAASGSLSAPKGAHVVNARGKFLIPGLWDMHTHVAGVFAAPAWARQVLLPLLVANGITGIRDMGGDLDALASWRKEISTGALLGPQIVAGGPMMLPPRRPTAAPVAAKPEELPIATPDEAREAVRRLQQRGADFIKIIDVPRNAYFAIAEESRKDGITFVGHVPSDVTAVEASNSGQKSIEHVFYSSLAFDCSSQGDTLRQKLRTARAKHDSQAIGDTRDEANRTFSAENAAALWSLFRKNGTWVTPTLFAIRANSHHLEDSAADPLLVYLPASLRKDWAPAQNPTQDDRDTAAWWLRQFENDRKLTGEMHRAGVRLLAGSDSLDSYVFVGASLHQELQQLVAAGLTPREALAAATGNPAEFLGRGDLGDVAKGKRADLVLLEANPLDDISSTQKISAVVLGGKYLSREDLDELLAKARAAAAAVPAEEKK